MTPEQIEEFLDWCFTTDPDYDGEYKPGDFRSFLDDVGGAHFCDHVSLRAQKYALGLMGGTILDAWLGWIKFPHPAYPTETEEDPRTRVDHCVCVIDGVAYDFTARQFVETLDDEETNLDYPVPYTWDWNTGKEVLIGGHDQYRGRLTVEEAA
jgi:hypothetical protein